jgi:hypothetical protein
LMGAEKPYGLVGVIAGAAV